MKKKILGIFVCMLMIGTAVPAVAALNAQTAWRLNEHGSSNLEAIPAASGIVTIKLTAKITSVTDPSNLLGGVIEVNDTVTGKYIYDSGVPDNSSIPSYGEYLFRSSSFGFEVNAGGLTFKTNPSNVYFAILMYNDFNSNPSLDSYFVYSLNNLQLENGMLCTWISWELVDYNCTALSSDALPATAPVLSDWVQPIGLQFNGKNPSNPSQTFQILAEVTRAMKNSAREEYDAAMATIPQNQQSLVKVTNDCTATLTQDMLWDNGLPNGYYALSSQYKPTPQISHEVVADVDASEPWVVKRGDFRIIINYVGGPEAITGVNVFVYKNQDDNTPSMVRYAERTATTFNGTYTGENYFDMAEVLMNVTFDPVTLAPGKWWICFQPVIDWETYWLASNLIGLGCYVSWPDYGYPKWTDDDDIPLIGKDIDVSFRLFGYIAQPPNTPTIEGPASGKINEPHDYLFNTTDPNGDSVSYYIDWGDNTTSGWIGPYPSGDAQTQSHTWLKQGSYTIRAKAKDIHGNESGWGTLSVTMPLSYDPPHHRFFQWLFERFPHAFPILRYLLGY